MSDITEAAPAAEPDYDRLLRANLRRVFNERDADARAAALDEFYVAEPILFEPDNVVRGRAAIGAVAGTLLDRFGPTFRFVPVGRGVGHHGMGSLRWEAGPEGGPVAVTGTDVAEIVDGRIGRLWVLLDPPAA
ncbi:nuclear transport factor 2 family protein [Methylobacterium sp. NMS14P]|uniref:nuclear transport factor 2 family protein n=1 Tax=Methylobacterium sp. NMS14P TaxID=2894310 RepID=UPI002358A793|nr:nuclear transport factor 2 family protein [Methylobacterium sp. NMS14P]WCS23421.1 nuclear transport factor 2 family protein [Methylobacterium sp. NMS14P]